MPYYQVEYTDKEGNKADDFLLEEKDIKSARSYAEHRIDGSYGETSWVSCKVNKISFEKALRLYDGNCICWIRDGSPFD